MRVARERRRGEGYRARWVREGEEWLVIRRRWLRKLPNQDISLKVWNKIAQISWEILIRIIP